MVSNITTVFMVLLCAVASRNIRSSGVMAQTTVEATAPLKIVKEGGILSLHCKISRQQSKQGVIISRKNGDDEERLSWDKTILDTPGNRRYFLAHRKLKDGSDVYFLSITEVTRKDEGEYICSTMSPKFIRVEKNASVHIVVRYFPSGHFPICDPTGPQRVLEGFIFTLNCSSEPGKPSVTIHWSRTGSDVDLLQTQVSTDNAVYSEVTFRPRLSDQDAMFVCKIKSKFFPNVAIKKCHVGPLTVIRNPDVTWPVTTVSIPFRVTEPRYSLVTNSTDDCHEVCAAMTSESVFRWTIATVIAGLLAIVFFIFGIVLLVRYCLALDDRVPPQEDIPDMPDMQGVQYRIDGNRLYMTLERPGPTQTEAVYHEGEVLERQYILAPTRGHFDGQYIGTPSRRDSEPPYLRTPVQRDSDIYRQSPVSPTSGPDSEKYMDNTLMNEGSDRQSNQETPMRNGGSLSLQGTPTRMVSDKVLTEAQSEGYIGTPTRRESEGYIGTPTRGESERLLFGTPIRGESERQRSLTPTLPPRRYKSHYV